MKPLLPLQQHPRFAQALRTLGQRAEVVGLPDEAGQALAVWRWLPLLGPVGYLPRGPAWRTEDPERRAKAMISLSERGIRLIEAEAPCPSLRLAGYRAVATPAHVADLDLTGMPEDRRRALGCKWRNALRQAERSGLTVVEELWRGDASHWLLAREGAMRRERGYRALPHALACAFARTEPGAARLLTALDGDRVVAGMLFLLHPPVATYHLGWTDDAGRALSAHHLMLMRGADRLATEGFARLDLGTVDTEAAPGLARFKIGTGARVRPLGGSWLRLPFSRALARRRASR